MSNLSEKIDLLRNTKDSIERNDLALELTETGDPRIQTILIELINRPELADYRGTLVHCLGSFDCSRIFPWLVNLVCTGNFEVAHEAFDITTDIEWLNSKDARLSRETLLNAQESGLADGWRAELVADLLAMFS